MLGKMRKRFCLLLVFVMLVTLVPGTALAGEPAAVSQTAPTAAPQGLPRSEITLPDRRLTPAERANWIAEYQAMGNAFAFELEVMRLTNAERALHGSAPLRLDEPLMWAARFYAQTLVQWGQLGHSIGPYGSSFAVMDAFAGTGWGSGVNGSFGQRTPQALVNV